MKLIKNDISLLEIDRSVYSSITEMIDPDRQLELVPESVKLLLTTFKIRYYSCLLGAKPNSMFRSGSVISKIRSTIKPSVQL